MARIRSGQRKSVSLFFLIHFFNSLCCSIQLHHGKSFDGRGTFKSEDVVTLLWRRPVNEVLSSSTLCRWTLMKNTTRRAPLIIHFAQKQSQQGYLETKVEAVSPFTASLHHTLIQPVVTSSLKTSI